MNKTNNLKRIIPLMLSLFLVFLILGAVSASDNNITDDSIDDDVLTLEDSVDNDIASFDAVNDKVGSADSNALGTASSKTFADLNKTINEATPGEDGSYHVDLTDDYAYNKSTDTDFKNGISIIHDNFIINGNGHVIDAKVG